MMSIQRWDLNWALPVADNVASSISPWFEIVVGEMDERDGCSVLRLAQSRCLRISLEGPVRSSRICAVGWRLRFIFRKLFLARLCDYFLFVVEMSFCHEGILDAARLGADFLIMILRVFDVLKQFVSKILMLELLRIVQVAHIADGILILPLRVLVELLDVFLICMTVLALVSW